jgi:hypothetical protein
MKPTPKTLLRMAQTLASAMLLTLLASSCAVIDKAEQDLGHCTRYAADSDAARSIYQPER